MRPLMTGTWGRLPSKPYPGFRIDLPCLARCDAQGDSRVFVQTCTDLLQFMPRERLSTQRLFSSFDFNPLLGILLPQIRMTG